MAASPKQKVCLSIIFRKPVLCGMSLKAAHLQALYARRREAAQNRIERTEAINKYFDHWGKVTARFENWTTPDYYKQAEQQLENSKQQKEKQKRLAERQEKLGQLLKMEKQTLEQEMEHKQGNKNLARSLDTTTLEKINENLERQQQMRQKLDLEAKLYGKWRHGVEDENVLFESKTDNEVFAKLNWLDKQVHQQMHHEKEQELAKERQLKLQQELNKSEELQKARQQIREKEIREIRCMQEYHLEQLKERQKETDELKEKEKQLKDNSNELDKELELLEESYNNLSQATDFGDAYNLNKIKITTRKRSEEFRNEINLCLSILERILDFAEKPEALQNLKKRFQQQLEKEHEKLTQLEAMYESEAKDSLRRSEQNWQHELTERYTELRQILIEEHRSINTALNDAMKRHEELLDIRATHMSVVENSTEKLKLLVQEEENSSPHYETQNITAAEEKHVDFATPHKTTNNIIHSQLEESADTSLYSPRRDKTRFVEPLEAVHQVDSSSRRNCSESNDNCMSPIYNDVNKMSNSFTNLNLDVYQTYNGHPSKRERESFKTNSQRSLQVVTSETEAERPRFGRKHMAWN